VDKGVEWEPVTMGQESAFRQHGPSGSDDISVLVKIHGSLDAEWIQFFNDPQVEPEPPILHTPIASGAGIRVIVEPGKEEETLRHINARVDQANKRYERDVVSRKLEEERRSEELVEQRETELQGVQRRLNEAARRLKDE
jgi:hypothetical protein